MRESNDFTKLFIKREGEVILGYKYLNLFAIILILTATFFSVGFSEGSKNYLEKKMSDPFNKWVCFDKQILLLPFLWSTKVEKLEALMH